MGIHFAAMIGGRFGDACRGDGFLTSGAAFNPEGVTCEACRKTPAYALAVFEAKNGRR